MHTLANRELLAQGPIEIIQAVDTKYVPAQGSEMADQRLRQSGIRDLVGIDAATWVRRKADIERPGQVRPLSAGGSAQQKSVGNSTPCASQQVDRRSRLRDVDTTEFPATECLLEERIRVLEPGDFIDVR